MSTTPTEGSAKQQQDIPRRTRRTLARMLSATPDAHPESPSGFSCVVVHAEDRDLVELKGELDLAGCTHLQSTMNELAASTITIDLSRLTFLDAKGLSLLEELRTSSLESGRAIEFRGGSSSAPIVRRMIRLTESSSFLLE